MTNRPNSGASPLPLAAALLLGAALVLATIGARAQTPAKPYRIGLLLSDESQMLLRPHLRDLGYVEGRDVVYEVRTSKGRADRIDDLTAELVREKVDVIVAVNPASAIAAKRATSTIPIIMTNTPDPVELGLVTSLAKPGGNVTGLTTLSIDVSVKQLELLQLAVPQASRIALLWNPDSPWHARTVRALEARSDALGIELHALPVRRVADFDGAFDAMKTKRVQAIVVLADPLTFFQRRQLAEIAIKHRLPMMGSLPDYAEAGSLMSYWPSTDDLFRRAASYIDRIFKGAKPADLPIEQPTKFAFIANLRTARAIGIALPQSVRVRADRIIE